MLKVRLLTSLGACAALGMAATTLVACTAGGGGMKFSEVSPILNATCVKCHDAANAQQRFAEIQALPDAGFTDTAFPDAKFADDLQGKSAQDLKAAGDSWLTGSEAQKKAWILHEMHELLELLQGSPAPDYTTQEMFTTFVLAGNPGSQEGCEMEERLDAGRRGDPNSGMNPQWAKELMRLLGVDFVDIADADRQKIRDYLDQLLPGGIKGCSLTGEVS